MNKLATLLFRPSVAPKTQAVVLVRVATGFVFIVSGALKFLYAGQGPSRFAHIGLPAPAALSSFVGSIEIGMGALVLVGLMTRLAAIPLVFDMLVAIATTKVPLIFGRGPEIPAGAPRLGFWAFAYQARLDLTMLLACAFFVAAGAGAWSLDAWIARRRWAQRLDASLREESAVT